ncbi:MAG: AgmX/PglI C-terminal domain-containing protein [Myxococcales bacterium]|nr:AgmX/PglI C-terminal domain-containing protein [Myxococcales bacterium]
MAARPNQSPGAPRPKILRIGILLGGKIVEERLVRERTNVTIGQSSKNTFCIPAPEIGRVWPLFRLINGRYALCLTETMDGRLSDGGQVLPLAQARVAPGVQRSGNAFLIPLSDTARGKVIVGDMTLLFQFVVAPPLQPRPQLPPSVRGTLADRIDPHLAIVLALSLLFHMGSTLYVYRLDPPKEVDPAEIPEHLRDLVVQEPPKPPAPKDTGASEEKKADEKKPDEKKPDKAGKPDEKKPDSSTDASAGAKQKARVSGALAILGSEGDGSNSSAYADVTGGKTVGGDSVKSALQDARDGGGLAMNEGGTGSKGTGSGRIGGVDGSGGTGPVETGGKGGSGLVETIKGDVKSSGQEEIDNEGLDAEGIFRKIRSTYMKNLEKCYNDALKANQSLRGAVEVTISIGPNGNVQSAAVDGFDPTMDSCVKEKARNWRFDNPDKFKGTFAYTFSFSPNR